MAKFKLTITEKSGKQLITGITLRKAADINDLVVRAKEKGTYVQIEEVIEEPRNEQGNNELKEFMKKE